MELLKKKIVNAFQRSTRGIIIIPHSLSKAVEDT